MNSDNDKINGMIDISSKEIVLRKATASGTIILNPNSIRSIRNKTNPKGDVLEHAKIAAIHGVKKASELIFFAHPIMINSVKTHFKIKDNQVECKVTVIAQEKTGVEIEAISGVMNALLTIFDVCKRFEKDENGQYLETRISDIKVDKKIKTKI